MTILLQNVLEEPLLADASVLAGHGGLLQPVSSVNVMDAPDFANWVKRGELVLTTAYSIKDHLHDEEALIESLSRRGCAGLCIPLGRFLTTVPDNMLLRANELDFPLIALPKDVRFSDIMSVLFARINDGGGSALSGQQLALSKLMTYEGQLSGFLHRLSEIFARRFTLTAHPSETCGAGSLEVPPETVGNSTDAAGPICYRGEYLGELRATHIDNENSGILPQLWPEVCRLLGQAIYRHQRRIAGILHDFLHGVIHIEEVESQMDRGHWSHPESYQCVTIFAEGNDEDAVTSCIHDTIQRMRTSIHLRSIHAIQLIVEGIVIAFVPESMITQSVNEADSHTMSLEECMRMIHRDVVQEHMVALHIAVSRRHHGLINFPLAYHECMQRIYDMRGMVHGGVYGPGNDELRMIIDYVSEENRHDFVIRMLGPLYQAGDFNRELLITLRTYLETGAQLNETASRLFIHRNTLVYRLKRIEKLLRRDLQDLNNLLLLKMAYISLEVSSRQPGS